MPDQLANYLKDRGADTPSPFDRYPTIRKPANGAVPDITRGGHSCDRAASVIATLRTIEGEAIPPVEPNQFKWPIRSTNGYRETNKEQEDAQGWSFTNQFVCRNCVDDYALLRAIMANERRTG
jgi:hypothetical protein